MTKNINTTKQTMSFFDQIINRRNTDSFRWDSYKGRDIIPLTVADMDFKSPPAVLEALQKVKDVGVFGYSHIPEELIAVLIKRLEEKMGWKVNKDWLIFLPGLIPGLNIVCRAIGAIGDEVMSVVPVYQPFLLAPGNAKKNLLTVPLMNVNDRWTFDFEKIEKTISSKTHVFLLCNPHNPGGTVFTKEELTQLLVICQKHQIVICSDEIHCDLVLDTSKKHIAIAALNSEAENRTITLISPSKTFNIAGLACSIAIIPNPDLKEKFQKASAGIMPFISQFAYQAALAAYRDSEAWHQELLTYLRINCNFLQNEINTKMPGLYMGNLEATYLAWIDTRKSGIENITKVLENAGVGLMDASAFGGEGFVRLNFACPKSLLEEVVNRMKKIF